MMIMSRLLQPSSHFGRILPPSTHFVHKEKPATGVKTNKYPKIAFLLNIISLILNDIYIVIYVYN